MSRQDSLLRDMPLGRAICAALTEEGWAEDRIVPCASKMFDSAVGPKKATVWIGQTPDKVGNIMISGEFWSEGRNVAGGKGVLINVNMDPDQVPGRVSRFLRGIEKMIAESYAVGLMRST